MAALMVLPMMDVSAKKKNADADEAADDGKPDVQ